MAIVDRLTVIIVRKPLEVLSISRDIVVVGALLLTKIHGTFWTRLHMTTNRPGSININCLEGIYYNNALSGCCNGLCFSAELLSCCHDYRSPLHRPIYVRPNTVHHIIKYEFGLAMGKV